MLEDIALNSEAPFSTGNMPSFALQGSMVCNVIFFSLLGSLWYEERNLITDFGIAVIRSLLERICSVYTAAFSFDPWVPFSISPPTK